MKAAYAYDRGITGKGVTIAVIDTGINYTINELKNAYKGGHNFLNGSDSPMDDNGHGTHVSGTIAAADDGSLFEAKLPGVARMAETCGTSPASA